MRKRKLDICQISTMLGLISIFSMLLLLFVSLLFYTVVTAAKLSGDITIWIRILDKICFFCVALSTVLPPLSGFFGLITGIIALRKSPQQIFSVVWSGISIIIFILILYFKASHEMHYFA